MNQLPALVTLLNVVLLFVLAARVGYARGKYEVNAPATSGHPIFERHMRVHMNTLESTVMFLPTLWVASYYGSALWSGIAGLVWVAARVWYALSYARDPGKRGPAFGLAGLAWLALLGIAMGGLAQAMIANT